MRTAREQHSPGHAYVDNSCAASPAPARQEVRLLQLNALDYQLIQLYLGSGDAVADTFYGPVSFDAYGQNRGKEPTTLQVRNGRERTLHRTAV